MTTLKKSFQIIAVIIVAGFMLLAASNMFSEGSVDLDKANKITGRITQAYKTTRRTSGKYASNAPVFAFRLDNYEQILGVYRPSKNYNHLLNNLRPGDVVTVTSKPMPQDKININVYKIEKAGQIVLDYNSYKRNHIGAAVLVSFIAILIFILATKKIISS